MHHIILYTTLLSTLIPTSHVAATLKSLTTATLLVDIQHGYCIVLFDDYRGLWVLPAAQRYSDIICTNGRVKNLLTRRRIYICVLYRHIQQCHVSTVCSCWVTKTFPSFVLMSVVLDHLLQLVTCVCLKQCFSSCYYYM